MNDQVVQFGVISFSGIIGIAVAQLIFGGGLDPLRLLALAALAVSLAFATLMVKRALARPAASQASSATANEHASPYRTRNQRQPR